MIGKYTDHGAVLEIMGTDVNIFFQELKIQESVGSSSDLSMYCTDAQMHMNFYWF